MTMYEFRQIDKENFHIYETATEQIIFSGGNEVRQIYRDLKNKGNGFRGWTPAFFVQNTVKKKK